MFLATIHLTNLLQNYPQIFLRLHIKSIEKVQILEVQLFFKGVNFTPMFNYFLSKYSLLLFSSPHLLFVLMHEGKFSFHFVQVGSHNWGICFKLRQNSSMVPKTPPPPIYPLFSAHLDCPVKMCTKESKMCTKKSTVHLNFYKSLCQIYFGVMKTKTK